jgi:hypothetical protein
VGELKKEKRKKAIRREHNSLMVNATRHAAQYSLVVETPYEAEINARQGAKFVSLVSSEWLKKEGPGD